MIKITQVTSHVLCIEAVIRCRCLLPHQTSRFSDCLKHLLAYKHLLQRTLEQRSTPYRRLYIFSNSNTHSLQRPCRSSMPAPATASLHTATDTNRRVRTLTGKEIELDIEPDYKVQHFLNYSSSQPITDTVTRSRG